MDLELFENWNFMNISHRKQVEEDISQQQWNRNELHKCNSIFFFVFNV